MITNTTRQRQLRGHMPRRVPIRHAGSAQHQAHLAARLTARDRWLARMLLEHKVLTTHQITALAWPSRRAANLRLRALYEARVVDRFQPFVTIGTAPAHYVLDTAGAVLLAHEAGLPLKALGYEHRAAIGIAHSLRLAHTVGTNDFFAALVHRGRLRSDHGRLSVWWSEKRCRLHIGDLARPDGYGRWHHGDREVDFFLEYDTGTETLAVLAAKLRDYADLAAATGITIPVLFWLHSTAREATARRVLLTAHAALDDPALVPVATTATDLFGAQQDPAAARWLPLHAAGATSSASRRCRLDELPARPASSHAENAATLSGTGVAVPDPMPPEEPLAWHGRPS
ncbi:replication-relaxation family protein [Allokutzneria sp. A3M-2-11 16]|uniref:replication-relaxation family protein n=1 Tax=Allokutzneria sp. A3M-2-11 16 TaxID=2962043 RepID=UPI0020B6E83D|nr:replication-relaxation family protein [Allokutzneria sp. A3M-2-11 16]MCP3800721.1 replication-relaxation family protein [Allokutzneria sp. A3M-2-11 16]